MLISSGFNRKSLAIFSEMFSKRVTDGKTQGLCPGCGVDLPSSYK